MYIPTIGITPIWDDKKESCWMLPAYMQYIEDAGALSVVLPLTSNRKMIKQMMQICDAFLFSGGHDVNPAFYGEAEQIDLCGKLCPSRDDMEAILYEEALRNNKPCLGICRGLQLINSLSGGKLYQDIPSQLQGEVIVDHAQKKPYSNPQHKISILPGTPLSALLKTDEWQVNSLHHQGVKQVSEHAAAMAVAEDGLIEAIYLLNHPFVWAVQWHPEYMVADACSQLLFQAFVEAAANSRSV